MFASLPRKAHKKLKESFQAFAISREITTCLIVIFINAFSRSSGGIFIQYVSKLLDWPISTSGYLLSVKAAVSLGILVGLAALTRLMTAQTSTPPLYLDVWVARSSLALLVVGNLIIGFSANSASVVAGEYLISKIFRRETSDQKAFNCPDISLSRAKLMG